MADLFAIFVTMLSLTLAGYIVRLLCRMVMSEQKKFKEQMMRDKFLTEAMITGKKVDAPAYWRCDAEYALEDKDGHLNCPLCSGIYFGDWEGFGKLWEFAQKQEWWSDFMCMPHMDALVRDWIVSFVHPDRFATAVYEFLKERNGDDDE